MNKKLLIQICEGQHERVEKNIENQIKKLNEMKLLSKVVSFASNFASHLGGNDLNDSFGDLRPHYGKKLQFSFGYQTNQIPQSSSVFYSLDGVKGSFSIEDGSEFLELLQLADGRKFGREGEIIIDHAFEPRLIGLILGDKIMEQYADASSEIGIMV